ncbi:hypothetical protein L3Y34_011376 [Caenorhabditis briggsae]|uniref:Uncharacterized protein n=1 Tax=Caenorhabditis briggsae TaxID=6238 RepID=A0AAE8ZW70_CAEBR|nr:hypothetical protein L3Y34_011376 [Caenorhabditis briggsae]
MRSTFYNYFPEKHYGRNERGQGRSNYGYSQNGSNSNLQDRGPYRDQGFNDSRNNYGYQTEPPRGQRRDYGNGSTRQPENRIDDRVLAEEAFRMTALGLKRNRRSSSHSSGGRSFPLHLIECKGVRHSNCNLSVFFSRSRQIRQEWINTEFQTLLNRKLFKISRRVLQCRTKVVGFQMLIRTRWLELKEFRIVLDCLTKKTEYQLLNGICSQEILLDRQGFQYHQCCEIRDMDLLTNRNFLVTTAGAQPPGHNDYPLAPTPPGIPNVGGAPYNAELMAALGYAAERLPNMGPPNGPSADPALIAVLGYGARGERNRPNAAHPHAHIPHGVPNFAANHHLGHRPDHPHRSRNMAPPVGAPADPAFMTARGTAVPVKKQKGTEKENWVPCGIYISLVQKKENGRSTIVFQ